MRSSRRRCRLRTKRTSGARRRLKALAEARFEYEGKLLAAEAAAAATLEEERARFEAAMAKQRSEADAAARAAEDAAKATIEETRAKAAEELKSVMASADTFRDNLDRQFKNEAKRARDEFDAQIKAYDQKLLDTSRDLTARHEQETKDLLAAHASEMEAKQAALDAESRTPRRFAPRWLECARRTRRSSKLRSPATPTNSRTPRERPRLRSWR